MFIFFVMTLTVFSQQRESWKEMEEFHLVMSTTFHPAEDDNLNPVKEKSADLLFQAMAWQRSRVPLGYDALKTTAILKRLVEQCFTLNDGVKKQKSDAELKLLITGAHEIFHEIMEKCHKE